MPILCHGVWVLLLLSFSAWGWQDGGCKHSPPLCQHHSSPTPVLGGPGSDVPVLCGVPSWGFVGPCSLQCPPAWSVRAYPCAQPRVNSSESAGASSLAATLYDSGRRNPLSWLFPSELQPLAQPIFGAALVSESAGTSWNPSQALTQPRARTERGGNPVSPIAELPHCVTTPVASPQSVWGNTSSFAGPHTEAGATCAMCHTLCKTRNSEGSQVTVGLHWGITSAAAHPPDPQGQSSLALPWDGASGAPGPTSWQDSVPSISLA